MYSVDSKEREKQSVQQAGFAKQHKGLTAVYI